LVLSAKLLNLLTFRFSLMNLRTRRSASHNGSVHGSPVNGKVLLMASFPHEEFASLGIQNKIVQQSCKN